MLLCVQKLKAFLGRILVYCLFIAKQLPEPCGLITFFHYEHNAIISHGFFYRQDLESGILSLLWNHWISFEDWAPIYEIQYSDFIMSVMASQITSLTTVYSTNYSGIDQRKHQTSASLAFVRGIHHWPVNSLHKGQWRRTCFHLMMSSCMILYMATQSSNDIQWFTMTSLKDKVHAH